MAARIAGHGFTPLRLILSMIASILSMSPVYRLVKLETGSRQAGLIAVGMRAAVSVDLEWLALARVDALMECLLLFGLYALRTARTTAGSSSPASSSASPW